MSHVLAPLIALRGKPRCDHTWSSTPGAATLKAPPRQRLHRVDRQRMIGATIAYSPAPIAMAPTALRAQDQRAARTYHDKQHNDDHAEGNAR